MDELEKARNKNRKTVLIVSLRWECNMLLIGRV